MDVLDPESHPYHLSWRPIVYLPWLVKEIVLSNIHVALMVLRPHKIHPHLVQVPTSQKTDLGRVIHANSITITPGTISLDLRDGHILVHALTDTTAEGVMSGDMDARVTRLEGAH
jgi:multicomponent Na+:H+ antiporter subunit E